MSNNEKVSFSPAQLRAMNDDQISSLFHSSNWDRIDSNTRLGLCQEVENRLAEQDGVEARTVIAEKMNGSVYGQQRDDVIAINVDMLNDGVFCTTYTNENGNEVTSVHSVDAPSWNTYDTIVHEHTHGVSLDKDEMPYTYISPKTDYDLYRIQGEERIAFAKGNEMTKEAIAKAEAAMNKEDYQKEDYLESIANDSYEKSLENAKMKYNDPFIDKTLATFINDRDNGITRENASPSYKQIEALYDRQLQLQLAEIMQSKEQITQQDIENAAVKAQDKTQEQITEMTAKENEVTKDVAVNEETVKNEAEPINNEEAVEVTNDGSISLDDGMGAEASNDGSVSLDDGMVAEASNDGSISLDDGMGAEASNDSSISLDDGSASFGDSFGAEASNDGGSATNEVEGSYEQEDAGAQNDGGVAYDGGAMGSDDDGGMGSDDDGGMSSDD